MIIFGVKTLRKVLGMTQARVCPHCQNVNDWEIVKYTTWFSLFFIPVIPLHWYYAAVCPICNYGERLTKEQAQAMLGDYR